MHYSGQFRSVNGAMPKTGPLIMKTIDNDVAVAKYLNIKVSNLRNSRAGHGGSKVPHFHVGRLVRYRKSDVDAYIESSLVK